MPSDAGVSARSARAVIGARMRVRKSRRRDRRQLRGARLQHRARDGLRVREPGGTRRTSRDAPRSRRLPARRAAVDIRRQLVLNLATIHSSLCSRRGRLAELHVCSEQTASYSCLRPRDNRDITVPIGIPSTSAISWYVSSSTSRSHTTSRNASGKPSSAACRSAFERVAQQQRLPASRPVPPRPAPARFGAPLHHLGIELDPRPRAVALPVPPGVLEDGVQPRLQVRALRRTTAGANRLQVRVLNQVLRPVRVSRQSQRRAVQRIQELERRRREPVARPGLVVDNGLRPENMQNSGGLRWKPRAGPDYSRTGATPSLTPCRRGRVPSIGRSSTDRILLCGSRRRPNATSGGAFVSGSVRCTKE